MSAIMLHLPQHFWRESLQWIEIFSKRAFIFFVFVVFFILSQITIMNRYLLRVLNIILMVRHKKGQIGQKSADFFK